MLESLSQELNAAQLKQITATLQPKLVIATTGCAMFVQLGEAFQAAGSLYVTSCTGIRVPGSDSRALAPKGLAERAAANAKEMWVVSGLFKEDAIVKDWLNQDKVKVVGHPTLNEWKALSQNTEKLKAERTNLYGETGRNHFTVCWLGGGMAGKGNNAALRVWAEAVKKVQAEGVDLHLAVAQKTTADNDFAFFQASGIANVVQVPPGMKSDVAALSSDLTVAQGSTGGIQALFAGKPAIFVDPEGAFGDKNVGTMLGLLPIVKTAEAAAAEVKKYRTMAAEEGKLTAWATDVMTKLTEAVPADPKEEIVQRVKALLN